MKRKCWICEKSVEGAVEVVVETLGRSMYLCPTCDRLHTEDDIYFQATIGTRREQKWYRLVGSGGHDAKFAEELELDILIMRGVMPALPEKPPEEMVSISRAELEALQGITQKVREQSARNSERQLREQGKYDKGAKARKGISGSGARRSPVAGGR